MNNEEKLKLRKQHESRLFETIKNIKDKTPVLLVGGAVTLFKKMYKGNIYKITSPEETRDFVANFYGLEMEKPVVVEDISLLSYSAQFLLLKLIEEAKFPVIILTLQDKVSSIILSRIKTYIKFPLDYDVSCTFMDLPDAQVELSRLIEEDKISAGDYEAIEKFYAENCPEMLLLEKNIGYVKNKNTYIEIMRGKEVIKNE